MAEVKWIKLVSNLFDNRKVKQIRKMPEGDAIIVIWLQLLCLAATINDSGLVYFSKDIPYTDEMLSTEFDRPLNTIRMALNIFVKFNMVEIVNDILLVSNWEKYQNTNGLERIREQTRKRVAKHRDKLLLTNESNVTETLHVTYSNAIDKKEDIDIDKDIEINIVSDIFKNYSNGDQSLYQSLKDFEKMRKSIKKPMTDRAKEMLLLELDKLSAAGENIIECLNQSIFHSWQGVFPVKRGDNNGTVKQPDEKRKPIYEYESIKL
ncbi:MAG: phage replisome organizer N-terminal domain-containing protein [Flavobacteriales bacterium]|jgi:predicted phage replisome organizer|nr:phage replisome organizer N-terminal domain-containing protein [Flavobacteriales bacterium]